MAKTYRTARGKSVDLGALINRNEQTRAVGNMNVNARGDLLDSKNNSVQKKAERLRKQYRRQIGTKVSDEPVAASKFDVDNSNTQAPVVKQHVVEKPVVAEKAAIVEPTVEEPAAKGGLAAAIAKAREVKQEPLKTPRQQARSKSGVKKI
jgi:hypothetical protein